MSIKQKFESIDQSQLSENQKEILGKIKTATKDFTITDEKALEKVDSALDNIITKLKATNPQAIKVEAKKREPRAKKEVVKKEPKSETKKPKKDKKESSGKRTIFSIAKEIRKADESWEDAKARAKKVMETEKKDTTKKMKTETDKLLAFIKRRKELEGLSGTSIKKDSKIEALPKGRRVSKKGWKNQHGESQGGKVYYENRDNRTDRLAPNFADKIYLADGGGVEEIYFFQCENKEIRDDFFEDLQSYMPDHYKIKMGDLGIQLNASPNDEENLRQMANSTDGVFLVVEKYADGGGIPSNYEIDRFKQLMNGKVIATYVVRLKDSFGNKKTYVFGIRLEDQFKGCELSPYEVLFGGWGDSGTSFSLSNLQVQRLVPNSFDDVELNEKDTTDLVTKLIKQDKAGVEKFLNTNFFYLIRNNFDEILKQHFQKSVSKYESSEFSITTKFADGGTIIGTPETPLGRDLGISYTGLVGETGAMSSGEMFADGGAIKNQYEGRTPEDIWNNLNTKQKLHFVYDHFPHNSNELKESLKEIGYKWKSLSNTLKDEFQFHVREGQYAYGGKTKSRPSMRELYIEQIAFATNTKKEGVDAFAKDNNLTDAELSNLMTGIGRKMISQSDFVTALVGNKNNTKQKEVVAFAKSDKAYKMAHGGGVDEKFIHEPRLLMYGFTKTLDSDGIRVYEKKGYKITINQKDKTYTADIYGRPETHKIYDKKYPLGRFIDLEFGTKFADGGTIIGTPETPLGRDLGISYTGLVGETGAMSSGEMFMNGGSTGLPAGAEQQFVNYYLNEGASVGVFEQGGSLVDGYLTDPNFGDFQAGVYAEGGSLGNHGLKQGDQIIKTMSGGVQKVKTKSGDIVYVNLANGYRGAEPPLPFDDGGMTSNSNEYIYASQLLRRGLMRGDLTQEEANSPLAFDIALEEAEDWVDAEEMGSSDFGYMYRNFLQTYKEVKEKSGSFDKGGLIGKEVTFMSQGEKDRGIIGEVNEDGSLAVDTGRSLRLVEKDEIVEIHDKPKKRGFFFDNGGTIDAFQMRTVKGIDNNPTEILTDEQKVQFARGGGVKKGEKYIPKAEIKEVWVKTDKDIQFTFKGSDVLNGVNVLEKGNLLKNDATYVAKRNIMYVVLKNGKKVKPSNGYWIKKDAKGELFKPEKKEKITFEEWMKQNNIEVYKRTYYWVADDGKGDYLYSGNKADVMKSLREDWKKSYDEGGWVDGNRSEIKELREEIEYIEKDDSISEEEKNKYISELKSEINRLKGNVNLLDSINNGDKVKTTSGETYYIIRDYSDNYFWATKYKKDRFNKNANGYTLPKLDVVEVIDKFEVGGFMNNVYAGGGWVDGKYDKNKLLMLIGDDLLVRTNDGTELILYNPYSNNDDNRVLWDSDDYVIGLVPNDGDEVKVRYEDIVSINKNPNYMIDGGKTTFKEKATAIAKNFEGKKVKPKYQKEYGKTYDKAEAKEVGNKIAGSQKAKYDSKMSGGGSTKRKPKTASNNTMVLAKQIRKDGESWQNAMKRAKEQLAKK